MRIGLDISPMKLEGTSGTVTGEVKQFGGTYGKTTDTKPEDVVVDNGPGIENLKLEVKYETLSNGSSKVYAKLVQTKMFKQITEDNWLLYAQKHYDNPTFDTEKEFWDDIKRFKYIKRLFRKYELTGDIKIRLVINHIVVLQNVFGTDACITLLLYKNEVKYWPILKSVFINLNYLYPKELENLTEDEVIKLEVEKL